MRRLVLIALVLLPLLPSRAEAVTVRDIIELTRAGLGEDVLLKQAGVSERVIEAMIRSGRTREAGLEQEQTPVSVEPPAPTPPVVIERQETVREVPIAVPVPVPVYVPIIQRRVHHVDVDTSTVSTSSPVSQTGTDHRREHEEPKSPPVYWGWGGQLRPDAWKPK
jgi:hypothetical protein